MEVVLKPSAESTIFSLADYISETIKMPIAADKYIDKLLSFVDSIAKTPHAYSVCKYPKWEAKNLQCATFDKNWVIAFKVVKKRVVIYHIKNGKLLNY